MKPTLPSFSLAILLPLFTERVHAEVFTGTISIGCTDGACTFSGVCDDLNVPGELLNDNTYNAIDGDVILSPSTCQADCTGCISISGSDKDEGGCISSAGYVYCPELDDCIRPWSENCPFEGTSISGPGVLQCDGGRCNNINDECSIEFSSAVVGGPYISDMDGNYTLEEGCTAICEGCTCIDCEVTSTASSIVRNLFASIILGLASIFMMQ